MKSVPICMSRFTWSCHERRAGRRQASKKVRREMKSIATEGGTSSLRCSVQNPFHLERPWEKEVLLEGSGWERNGRSLRRLTHSLAAPEYRFWSPAAYYVRARIADAERLETILMRLGKTDPFAVKNVLSERDLRIEWFRSCIRK